MQRRWKQLFALAVALLVGMAAGAPAGWRPVQLVRDNAAGYPYPAMAVDGYGGLHVMYVGGAPQYCASHRYSRSLDGGITWSHMDDLFHTTQQEH
jgi:hypothetical protein